MSPRTARYIRYFVDYAGLAFFIVALVVTRSLVEATWGLMAGAAAAVVVGLVFERRLAPMAFATAVLAIIFGALTVFLHDPKYIKMKPTILYVGFAAFLFTGLARGKNPLRVLMGDTFQLPDPVVRVLTWRYGLFFLALAAGNEITRRVLSDVQWGWYKLACVGFMFVFTLTQMPLILKHTPGAGEPDKPTAD